MAVAGALVVVSTTADVTGPGAPHQAEASIPIVPILVTTAKASSPAGPGSYALADISVANRRKVATDASLVLTLKVTDGVVLERGTS